MAEMTGWGSTGVTKIQLQLILLYCSMDSDCITADIHVTHLDQNISSNKFTQFDGRSHIKTEIKIIWDNPKCPALDFKVHFIS